MPYSALRTKVQAVRRRWPAILQLAIHLGALAPLAVLLWDGPHGGLTVNPIQAITLRTGRTALVLLVLSLVCTPASALLGWRWAIRLRRPLGLYAFLYASLHFLTFTVLDYGLDPLLLREAIFEKRYALVGFAALALLVPLAITSTKGWMRRLGKRWRRLHRLVYVAAALVIVHYLWLVKADTRVPFLYGGIVALLLLVRVPGVRQRLTGQRGRPKRPADGMGVAVVAHRPTSGRQPTPTDSS